MEVVRLLSVVALLISIHAVDSIKFLEAPKDNATKSDVAKNPPPTGQETPSVEAKKPDVRVTPADEINNRAKRTLFGAVTATADSTYKSLSTSGARKYDAQNAVTRGGGYWCSEANIMPDREISWTAELRGPRVLTGITIVWVYAPQMVSVSAKRQRNDKFEEVLPYQAVDAGETTQSITFKRKVDAQFVKVTMKGQANGYFGIEFVQFQGEPNPVFRIQAGITSIDNMCLQVDDSGEVVLESCISAIASFRFNDLWRYNEKRQIYNPTTNLCMTLENDVATDGGRIVMLPCDKDAGKGINSWDVMPNNQIKLRRPGNLCLSQAGSRAGLANVALNKIALSNLPRKHDPQFNAERALDGNLQSYWASEWFTLDTIPEKVEFIVNLQEYYKVRKLEIDWEVPALVYNILVRKDDEEWTLIKRVRANTLSKTVDEMQNKAMRFIKVELIRPNPEYVTQSGKIFYGIRSLAAYSNRLKTIVEPCDQAKTSKDARDKYFLESIYEVDIHSGEQLKTAEQAIETMVENMERKIAHIENLNGKMQQCKMKYINARKLAQELERSFERVSNAVYGLEAKLELQEKYKTGEQASSDCVEIKNLGENNPTGFYSILPPCAQRQLRVYCDMYTGASYYLAEVESGRIGLPDVYAICRRHGLEPLQLQHNSQIEALKIMLKTMDMPADNLYPIAVKVGQKFKSLDLEKDVTWALDYKTDAENNIVAISTEGTQYIDGRKTDFSGIVCSTNYSSLRLPPKVIKLGCHTLLKEHATLNDAAIGTVLQVSCPKNCMHNYDEATDVEGGNNGLYTLKTPICIAAIHAGEYSKNATLDVQKAAAPVEFEGFFQNGIQSTSVPAVVGDLAFKVTRRKDECSPKKVEPLVEKDAETKEKQRTSVNIQQFKTDSNHGIRMFNQSLTLDPATGEAIGELVNQVNQQSGKSSPVFLDMFNHHFSETISRAIQLVKVADIQRQPIEETLDRLDDGVKSLQKMVQWLAARMSYKKEPLVDGIRELQREAAVKTSFEPWSSHGVTPNNLFDLFHPTTVGNIQGVPKWSVSTLSLKTTPETVISQTSEFIAHGPVSGALLYLANANYYDFIYSAAVFAGGSGTLGLVFRVVDENNYYLFQMIQMNGGFKRLVRVVNGDPFEIAKIEDGGFIDGVLYTIRIEARQCRISISILQGIDTVFDVPAKAIDVIDCTHGSGSVGLFSGQINLVHFSRMHVETLPCIRYDRPPLPPKPPLCSIYREGFTVGLNANWRVLDNSGRWSFENNVGGESRVIVHRGFQAIDGTVEPSIIVLKGGRSCRAGVFRVSIFPQCDTSGLMGLIVHFADSGNYVAFECSGRTCRMIQMHKSTRIVLAETSMKGMVIGAWNTVELVFKPDAVTASIGTNLPEAVFINTAVAEDVRERGTVGIYSLGCAGCAFAGISLTPNYAVGYAKTLTSSENANTSSRSAREEQCMAIDRLDHCKAIAPANVANCEANYCTFCCEQQHRDAPGPQDVCYNRCRNLDHAAVLLQKTVDHFWRSCAPNSNSETNDQKGSVGAIEYGTDAVGDCELCCESSLFIEGVSAHINRAAQARCRSLCSS